MTTRIPNIDLRFEPKYDVEKMRRLQEHINRITDLLQRLQQMLDGGQEGQVLTKTDRPDFAADWDDQAAAGGLTLDSGRLLGRFSPGNGPPEPIEIGANLQLVGDTLEAIVGPVSTDRDYPCQLGHAGI